MAEYTCDELKKEMDRAKGEHAEALKDLNAARTKYNEADTAVDNAEKLLRAQQAQPDYLGKERDVEQKQEDVDDAWAEKRAAFKTFDDAKDKEKTESEAYENWSALYKKQGC